jgi:hypothetical protein
MGHSGAKNMIGFEAVSLEEARTCYATLPDSIRLATLSPDYLVADAKRDCTHHPTFLRFKNYGELFFHGFHQTQVPQTPFFDIQSPYGYGGPLSTTLDPRFLREAWAAYVQWCTSQEVAIEFMRFHPMAQNWKYYGGLTKVVRQTVSIPLSTADLAATYSTRCRTSIRKANKNGLVIEWTSPQRFLETFPELYRQGMDALGARREYYFGNSYFEAICALAQARCAVCVSEGYIIAGAIFFEGPTTWEYHLSASSERGRILCAANLLIHEAATMAQLSGARFLYLGGGLTSRPDDSLFFFKSGFSKCYMEYRIGSQIHNADAYHSLTEKFHAKFTAKDDKILFYR